MTEQEKKSQIIQWVVTGILMALGFYNQLAQIKGWAHFEIGDAVLTRYVTWFYELIVGAWAFWSNNNITSFAQLAQVLLEALKTGKITPDQVQAFLNNPEAAELVEKENITLEDLITIKADSEIKEIIQAVNDGKDIEVKINE